ncbi:MAG: hypothetical protein ACRDGA_09405 [Bacteroidota bacterium]
MVVFQFYFMSNMPYPTSSPQPPSMEEFEALFRQTMLMSLLMGVLLLTWLLSIGFAANRRVEQNLRLNTRLAIGCALYATSYIALAQFIFPGPGSSSSEGVPMALVAPLHLLATIAIFYVLAFAARNIIMAERQSAVSFFDYSGPFFLLWFFPIGVWFVQPRVNRLVQGR